MPVSHVLTPRNNTRDTLACEVFLAALTQTQNSIALELAATARERQFLLRGESDALAHAEKANALRPDQPAFMDTMAMILAERNQLGKALEIEKRAVGLQPQHAPFRLNLARLYIQSGDKASAKMELDQLAKLGDKFPGQAEVERLLKTL